MVHLGCCCTKYCTYLGARAPDTIDYTDTVASLGRAHSRHPRSAPRSVPGLGRAWVDWKNTSYAPGDLPAIVGPVAWRVCLGGWLAWHVWLATGLTERLRSRVSILPVPKLPDHPLVLRIMRPFCPEKGCWSREPISSRAKQWTLLITDF